MQKEGIVPGFKYDVFVSYAHANNQFEWITHFQEDLSKLLWEQLGEPRICWDQRDLDGKTLDKGIRSAVYESAVFVPILSTAFLRSEYCVPLELDPFVKFPHPVFPLEVRTHKRIVVVGYDPEKDFPRTTWPEVLRDAPYTSFCDLTTEGDRVLYARLPERDPRDQYWVRLGRIVRHLRAVLEEMQKGPSGEAIAELPAPSAPAPKPPAAWRKRWKKSTVHLRYHGVDKNTAEAVAKRVEGKECDVTFLWNEVGDSMHEAYLKHSDAEILFFGCEVMDWARLDALRVRDLAGDQGRPKRLGVLTKGECPNRFGILSDFIVPLNLTEAGDIEGLDKLLEGLSG